MNNLNQFNNYEKKSDLYKILGISSNASEYEIKKSYKKLALQFHPDKNKLDGSNEKFIEIKYAYDILSDSTKRKEYDSYLNFNTTDSFKYDFCESMSNFNNSNNPNNPYNPNNYNKYRPNDFDFRIFNFLNNNIFLSNIRKIATDKNYLNLIEIIYNKFKNNSSNTQKFNSLEAIGLLTTLLDIDYIVEITLKELYDNIGKKIIINRVTKNKFIEMIYPIDQIQIYENEGEQITLQETELQGNITIKINIVSDRYSDLKYHIVKNDLYCYIPKELINNNIIIINYLDGNNYELNVNDRGWELIDIGKIYKMENKGLCYHNNDSEYIEYNDGLEILRGDVYFIILI
jgi:DnaJ-class molecular chaperone